MQYCGLVYYVISVTLYSIVLHHIIISYIIVCSISLPQIRRQRELPRTSEVCPYIVKYLILRTSEALFLRG